MCYDRATLFDKVEYPSLDSLRTHIDHRFQVICTKLRPHPMSGNSKIELKDTAAAKGLEEFATVS